jgi:lipopolysaccharide export system protein LptA
MKGPSYEPLLFSPILMFAALLIGLMLEGSTFSEASQNKRIEHEPAPIVIDSNSLEMDNDQKTIIFTGNVKAKRDDLVINCQKVVVHYEQKPTKKGADDVQTSIRKIVATGKVKIDRTNGGTATTETAVYYAQEEKIVLMGKSVVKQGNDFIEGDKITIFLKENRSVVESAKDKKVRAIIFPKREER